MASDKGLENELANGITGMLISVVLTYLVSFGIPTEDLSWALIAVAVATFFSGFFASYYARHGEMD